MSTIGIVIPAYRPDVDRLSAYVESIRTHVEPSTIRVELDAPTAETREAIESLNVELNAVPERRGKGVAITDGFEALESDVLAFADADGATPARSLSDVIDTVRDGIAPICVGSRRHPESNVRSHQTVARRHLGDGFAWLARRLLDVSLYDYQCGAKALTRDVWKTVRPHLHERGFAWDLELLTVASAMGFSIAEQPVTWEDVDGSTVDPVTTSIDLLRALLSVRHRSKVVRKRSRERGDSGLVSRAGER